MRDYTKVKRSKLGRVLNKVYKSEQVKKLINYPDLSSLKISASGSNVDFKIEQNGAQNKKDLSDLIGEDLSQDTLDVDISKKTELLINTNQASWLPFEWQVDEIGYDLKFTDGSNVKQNIVSDLKGDGIFVNPTEPYYVTALTVDLPPPPGWLKLD